MWQAEGKEARAAPTRGPEGAAAARRLRMEGPERLLRAPARKGLTASEGPARFGLQALTLPLVGGSGRPRRR